jgi:intein/homing endonuclease
MEWVGGNMGCLTESANIFTCEGKVKSIKELQVNDKILSMNLEAKTFEEDRVVNKVLSGKKDVFELTVAGRKICASKNHPFLRVERRKLSKNHKKAFFETNWTNLEDLKVGDLIAIAKKVELVGVAFKLPKFKYDKMVSSNNQYSQFTSSIKHLYKPIKFPSYSTQDFMWFLGLWVGDGNIWFDKKSGGAKINIAIPKSSDIREKLLEVIKNLFDCPVNVSADRYVVINSVPLASLLKELGFGQIDFQKEIPEWVYTLPHDQKMSFIAGYFDADGHCGANGLYFTSVSYKLLNDLQLLAIQCGFGTSKIFKHRDAGPVEILGVMCNSKNTYRLILNGSMVYELTTKSMRYKKLISQIKTKRNYSTANGLNFKSKTSDYLGFAKIDNIQFIGTEETYDIEVEKNPNFIANGIVVHNSGVTMLYPATILKGRGAHADHLGVAFANAGQIQDTGAKVIHAAPDTSCNVVMKSLSKGGGVAMYRGLLQVNPNAYNVTARVECDALILDDYSRSDTVPDMKIMNNDVTIAHEASAGKLNEEDIFYLTSRGIDEETAKGMIVNGFIEPIVRELPLEYAVELNRLIELEMEGSVG